jgi:ribosomal protein S18 acetylase RimI-like enzyme
MIIREFTRDDTKSILLINRTCHDEPEPDAGLLDMLAHGRTWVAVQGGAVVGFLLSTRRYELEDVPYVYNVSVLPGYRRMGVATGLFKAFHEFYKGSTVCYLYVAHDNPAQKLYFDLGYRVVAIKKNFYGQDEDALIMLRDGFQTCYTKA